MSDNHAWAIAEASRTDDMYHYNRTCAAQTMVRTGRQSWRYVTQYSSGTCEFTNPTNDKWIMVRTDGTLFE